jgi:ribosome-binding factor A
MSLRIQRIRELLKRELGEMLRREIPVGEAGLVSVNEIDVSKDLHAATVFVGVLGSAEQKKRAATLVEQNRRRFQAMIARSVVLKYTPQLRFVVDDSIERGHRVLEILEELDKTSPPE